MSYSKLRDLVGANVPMTNVTLVAEKLEQWEWYARFIEMNPDLQERWEQHKTFEILNNEQL